MLKNGRPYHLPQLEAPYDYVLEKLYEEGVNYKLIEITPAEDDGIYPSQDFIFSDEAGNFKPDDKKPIWLANKGEDMGICDGHHRYFGSMNRNVPTKAVHINMEIMDACRLLNKIQDIYDYEKSRELEEVEVQDTINTYRDDENQFLNSLEEDNALVQSEIPSVNQQTIIAYRKEPIKENSVVGNFFTLNPVKGYSRYQIEFDNLLDTNSLGVTYKDSQEPVDILSKVWFPHVNFEQLSKEYNIPVANIKNKAIAEKAMKMGYDGIKYGDTLIQGLK